MTTVPSGIWPIDPNVTTGTDLATYLNTWMDAFQSMQASPTRPPLIAKGGVWAKTLGAADIALMFYDGTADHEIGSVIGGAVSFGGGVSVSTTAPTPATLGDTWVDTSVAGAPTMRVYNGTSWAYVSDKLLFGGSTKAEATATGVTVTDTLNVAKISDGTDTVKTSYVINGPAKAWVNFNGTGTIAIRNSMNVSSLTDNGTGDCTVNFSNAFSAKDYVVSGLGVLLSVGNTNPRIIAPSSTAGILETHTRIAIIDDAATRNDCDTVCVLQHGDLA